MSDAITAISAVAGNPAIQTLASALPLPSQLQSVLFRSPRRIATIIPDVVIEEDHSDRLTVTQHPVMTGVPISDHAYRMPYQVTMRCGWTNANAIGNALQGFGASLIGGASFGDAVSAGGTQLLQSFTEQRITAIYAALRKLQFDNTAYAQGTVPVNAFTLVTGKRTYPNMVITELSVRTDRTSEYSLMVEAHFQEVMIVTTKFTTQPAQTDQASPSQTASPTDQGDKTVAPPEDVPPTSPLLKWFGPASEPPTLGGGGP